jgi:hypothetical protein
MKSYFFFDVETGAELGKFVLPRDQSLLENCTIHNYNIVPLKNKNGKPRYVLVSGNYQAGISVVDFSDPANAQEIAYAIRRRSWIRIRLSGSSSAATGRPTGTTGGSTNPTSREA